jgi:hypothetical protein
VGRVASIQAKFVVVVVVLRDPRQSEEVPHPSNHSGRREQIQKRAQAIRDQQKEEVLFTSCSNHPFIHLLIGMHFLSPHAVRLPVSK